MMTTSTTTEPKWKGWYRPSKRSPWRVIVQGDDEKDVHNRMIDESPGGDLCLLEGHRDPNDDKRAR